MPSQVHLSHRAKWIYYLLIALIVAVVSPGPFSHLAQAVTPDGGLSSCTAVSTPHRVDVSQTADYTFQVTNTDSIPIKWLRILAPSSYYSIISGSADGWQAYSNEQEVLFEGGQINPGATFSLTITASTGIVKTPVEYWEVIASADNAGADAIDCTGDTSTAIGIVGPPAISDVHAVDISSSSATIFWTTERPATSTVEYGPTTAYGSSKTSSTLSLNHNLTLTGLKPLTGYHFRVSSSADSTIGYSSDSTFFTTAPPPPAASGSASGTNAQDTVPPTIVITTALPKPVPQVPTIHGLATDNLGLKRIEYTTDGGHSWLPVDQFTPSTTKVKKTTSVQAAYQFTPVITQDGNYTIQTRATDDGNNQTLSTVLTLIIDRLPPRFGPSTLTIGPQTLQPAPNGSLVLASGLDHRITLSLVGGPISVTLTATNTGSAERRSFSLSQNPSTGLWTGLISLTRSGVYRLEGDAIDGAGNRTQRLITILQVAAPVRVIDNHSQAVTHGTATLYYLNPETRNWSVWDGAAYGQQNPVSLDQHGSFNLLAPPGKYYLKVSSGSATTVTRTFTTTANTPLSGSLNLAPPLLWKIGRFQLSLPWTRLETPPLHLSTSTVSATPVGNRLPVVPLLTTAGASLTPVDWYGKPTVVAVLSTWAPESNELLPALEQLHHNTDLNIVGLTVQQPTETTAAYQKITSLGFDLVTDPDGRLSDALTVPGLPTLYFIDRHGIIKKVATGSMSASQITTELSHL